MNNVCRFVFRTFLLLTAMPFYGLNSFGQSTIISEDEGLSHILNDTIKKEIASFTITSLKDNKGGNLQLKYYFAKSCTDTSIYFDGGFFTDWIVRLVSDVSQKRIKEIDFVPHGKGTIYFPDSAFDDLISPIFCIDTKLQGRNIKLSNRNCKVLISKDKRRLYIYCLTKCNYEVTWIIKNNKYFGRVVNKI